MALRIVTEREARGAVVLGFLRRVLLACAVAVAVKGVLWLRGVGELPPTQGSWRELSGPDLR